MVDEELGSGPAVDENLDLEIGSTGDIKTVSGREELSKDLSLNVISELRQYFGSPPTPNTLTDIETDSRLTALADERVLRVERVDATFDERKEISVTMDIVVESGAEYNLVIEV